MRRPPKSLGISFRWLRRVRVPGPPRHWLGSTAGGFLPAARDLAHLYGLMGENDRAAEVLARAQKAAGAGGNTKR